MHPQSVIHGMVEFTDGATIAQLSMPDMRLPDRPRARRARPPRRAVRRHRLDHPRRSSPSSRPTSRRSRACALAYAAGRAGGGAPGRAQRRQRGRGRGVPRRADPVAGDRGGRRGGARPGHGERFRGRRRSRADRVARERATIAVEGLEQCWREERYDEGSARGSVASTSAAARPRGSWSRRRRRSSLLAVFVPGARTPLRDHRRPHADGDAPRGRPLRRGQAHG